MSWNWPGVGEIALPVLPGEVEMALEELSLPDVQASGLRVRAKGNFSQIVLQCRELRYRGMVFKNVVLEARDVRVSPSRLLQEKKIFISGLGELRPSVQVNAETLRVFLSDRWPWVQDLEVSLRDGIHLQGKAGGVPFRARASCQLVQRRKAVRLALDSVEVSGIPLPVSWFRGDVEKVFPLRVTREPVFDVAVEDIRINNGLLTIRGGQN
ncbi:MAG: hypothetical protein HY548_09505 [Elusimicrobia bacterium]|nr:hypothetical protein [Elusimicrobiota bacterium]